MGKSQPTCKWAETPCSMIEKENMVNVIYNRKGSNTCDHVYAFVFFSAMMHAGKEKIWRLEQIKVNPARTGFIKGKIYDLQFEHFSKYVSFRSYH